MDKKARHQLEMDLDNFVRRLVKQFYVGHETV
jgi:hypothetical protein